jgi:hypothetical protein
MLRPIARLVQCLVAMVALSSAGAAAETKIKPRVALAESDPFFTLTNQQVSARISKRSGDLVSLKYQGLELLEGGSGHPYAYWSHTPGRGSKITASPTIDPSVNCGDRAEVSIKGVSGGARQGNGPGGSAAVDIEIRYALGRDDSGLYTWCIFEHPADYPDTSIGEARFGSRLSAPARWTSRPFRSRTRNCRLADGRQVLRVLDARLDRRALHHSQSPPRHEPPDPHHSTRRSHQRRDLRLPATGSKTSARDDAPPPPSTRSPEDCDLTPPSPPDHRPQVHSMNTSSVRSPFVPATAGLL